MFMYSHIKLRMAHMQFGPTENCRWHLLHQKTYRPGHEILVLIPYDWMEAQNFRENAGSSEPLLLADVISNKILCAGPNV